MHINKEALRHVLLSPHKTEVYGCCSITKLLRLYHISISFVQNLTSSQMCQFHLTQFQLISICSQSIVTYNLSNHCMCSCFTMTFWHIFCCEKVHINFTFAIMILHAQFLSLKKTQSLIPSEIILTTLWFTRFYPALSLPCSDKKCQPTCQTCSVYLHQ